MEQEGQAIFPTQEAETLHSFSYLALALESKIKGLLIQLKQIASDKTLRGVQHS